jgi:Ti-type conjugative transfer relaxase TraA
MMSIYRMGTLGTSGKAAAAASHYYSEKGADYYVKDQPNNEHVGEWLGQGARRLGLTGGPGREDLQLALAGYLAGRQVQNAGRAGRRIGWDMTFSTPKSVSLAWAFADPAHRQEIRQAHVAAVKVAYDFLESRALTRRGKGGHVQERAYLASAMFTHHTSREGDPQLHSHVVVPNLCVRSDGTMGTLESQTFYQLKMAAGALYQVELAFRMRGLGYAVESGEKGTSRLAGANRALEQQFSKRGRTIDRVSKERGIKSYKGTRQIVKETRPAKKHTALADLLAGWRKEAREAGLPVGIDRNEKSLSLEARQTWMKDNLAKAGQKLTEQQSTFYERDHIRQIARSAFGILNARQVLELADKAQFQGHVRVLGQDKHGQIMTTPEMEGIEREMVTTVCRLAEKKGFEVEASKAMGENGHLSAEQRYSVVSATSDHAIAVIQGRAGAGKTTTLSAIRKAYELAGWKVQGLALSGQAAHNMQKESGIESRTIASWMPGPRPEPKTALVVDEAGMVGSRMMNNILQKAHQGGSKVILVGDERQLQPIDAGGALRAVDQMLIKVAPLASSQIQTIRRQNDDWMRTAVFHAAQGRTAEALKELDEKSRINVYKSGESAARELVRDFLDKSRDGFERSLILTHRKGDASSINGLVREQLRERGLVGEDVARVHNSQREIDIATGDRLMFLKNDYRLGVRNGQRGTVKSIDEKTRNLTVRTDDGLERSISLENYPHLEYGWASTTHKAQGATVDRAYVFGYTKESLASQQMTYVQISRARIETKIYVVAGERVLEPANRESGNGAPMAKSETRAKVLQEMTKNWSRDGAKGTSLEPYRQPSKGMERD